MSLKTFFQKMMCSNSRKDDFTEEQTTARSALPVEPKTLEKKMLVLDLDDTLICTRKQSFGPNQRQIILSSTKGLVYVLPRPHLHEFLEEVSHYYTIAIFTTGSNEYARIILKKLGISKYIEKLLCRKDCTREHSVFVKDLSKLGVHLRNVVLIDDTPDTSEEQPENALIIERFEGHKNDDLLPRLASFLKYLASCNDVRDVTDRYIDFLLEEEKKMKAKMKTS